MPRQTEQSAGADKPFRSARRLRLLDFRDWTTWVLVAVPLVGVVTAYSWLTVPIEEAQRSLESSTQIANIALTENSELKAQLESTAAASSGEVSTTKYIACRDASHGIERYNKRTKVTRESNWFGGGFSQPVWCKQLTAMLKGKNPLSVMRVVSSSERSESKCKPFNCPQYKYSCTIEIQSAPIFVMRESPACPPVDGVLTR